MVGANAVLNPRKAITKSAVPVIRSVFKRLFEKRIPNSPTSSSPTATVIVKTNNAAKITHRLLIKFISLTIG